MSWRGAGRLVWLVPAVLALREMGPNGVQSAQACSGGVPGEGWDSVEVVDAPEATRVSVATDGFVLLEAVHLGEFGEPAVRVTDDQDSEVKGRVQVLRSRLDLESGITQLHVAWQADELLELGTVLQLTWSTDDLGERSVELEVVGEPSPLPEPTAKLGAWVDVRHGVGDVSYCEAGEGACGVFSIDVPTNEVPLRGVQVAWELPEITGMVAWEVRAETSTLRARSAGPEDTPVIVGRRVISRPSVAAGLVTFADDTVDHCVVVVVKDLRTDEEVRSEPSCGEPAEPKLMRADHGLRDCWEPPTKDSVPLWCEGRTDAPEICDGDWEPAQGGAGHDVGDDIDEGGSGNDVGAGGRRDVPMPRGGTSGPDDGCQFAPAGGTFSSVLVALVALLSGVARRRRSASRR